MCGGWRADTLTDRELELEGMPNDMTPDEFWQLLTKAGSVADDGTVCRIAFEGV